MTLKGPHTFAALHAASGQESSRCSQFPHLDSLVQTTADQVTPVGSESHRVNTVFVAIRVLQSFHKIASGCIPNANALVERSGGDIMTVRRHGHSGYPVFDTEGIHKLALQNIPQAHCLISATRSDIATISSKVE